MIDRTTFLKGDNTSVPRDIAAEDAFTESSAAAFIKLPAPPPRIDPSRFSSLPCPDAAKPVTLLDLAGAVRAIKKRFDPSKAPDRMPDPNALTYELSKLMAFPTESEFISAATLAALGRSPTVEEFDIAKYLEAGRRSRIEVLVHFLLSGEGKARKAHVAGMPRGVGVYRWTRRGAMAGLVRWLADVVRLPGTNARLRSMEADRRRMQQHLAQSQTDFATALEACLHIVEERLASAQATASAKFGAADVEAALRRTTDREFERVDTLFARHFSDAHRLDAFARRLEVLETARQDMSGQAADGAASESAVDGATPDHESPATIEHLAAQIAELRAKMEQLDTSWHGTDVTMVASTSRNGVASTTNPSAPDAPPAVMDIVNLDRDTLNWSIQALSRRLLDLDHQFRVTTLRETARGGSTKPKNRREATLLEAEVRRRFDVEFDALGVYREAYFEELQASIGSGARVAQLGCNNPIFLSQCKFRQIPAFAVEPNPLLAEELASYGHEVVVASVVEHLTRLEAESLGGLVSLTPEIFSHPGELQDTLLECFRVLRPGGVIFFEMPNPEDLQIATRWLSRTWSGRLFHSDIVAVAARYAGFMDISIRTPKRLVAMQTQFDSDDIGRALQRAMTAPAVFTLAARKAG